MKYNDYIKKYLCYGKVQYLRIPTGVWEIYVNHLNIH
jgi:hypothetical protein